MASSRPRIAIVIYSLYDHITQLAEAEKKGIEEAGGQVSIYRVEETLSLEVLKKMRAPEERKSSKYDIFTKDMLTQFDAFLFGVPTRFGNMPTQWKTLWDATGSLWVRGALAGKYAGMFTSTGGLGGGQEETGYTLMTTLVHQGIIFVPFGYSHASELLGNIEEVHGGSPWGAGTVVGPDGSRQPSELELEMAKRQGKGFYQQVSRVRFQVAD